MLYSVDFYWFSNTIIAFLRCSVNSHDKKIEKEATAAFSILSFICIGAPKLLGNLQVLTAIVGSASLTHFGHFTSPGALSFHTLFRLVSRLALEVFLFGTAISVTPPLSILKVLF